MDSGKIVYKGTTKTGREILIRYPTMSDASAMSSYINTLSDEQTYITFQGEHMTVEDETAYLEKELKNIAEQKGVFLLVFSNNRLIGISSIDLGQRTSSHVGIFGISVAKDYRSEGIGKILMETVHQEATERIPKLKIVYLGLFANNFFARAMYEKFGYQEYGSLPEGIFYKGDYIDHVYMYKKIR
jgi:L-phenylalanine/L-methionine N-acetyltransferase